MKKAVRMVRVLAALELGKVRLFIRDERPQEHLAVGGKPHGGVIYFKSDLPFPDQQTKSKDTMSAPIIQTQTHFLLCLAVPLYKVWQAAPYHQWSGFCLVPPPPLLCWSDFWGSNGLTPGGIHNRKRGDGELPHGTITCHPCHILLDRIYCKENWEM